MSTLNQLREGLNEAWDTLLDGWQRLYRRAAGAITRFTPGKAKEDQQETSKHEVAERSAGWGVLAAEVLDEHDKVVVRLEVPGMDKADFGLEILDNFLVVRGEKQMTHEQTQGRYHVTECAYGCFERAIPLPDEVDTNKVKATYKNGVLRVELSKSDARKRRSIKVEVK